ncbi:MAG: AAA family ATPase [Planctomycetes bacterium]|nr:AAA family ATPase [Planctomycetota bacterium]
MKHPIEKLTLRGYKSIRALEDFELRAINVLIGANGAGKSNFVSFFAFLRALVDQSLQLKIAKAGGADRHLYLGPRVTSEIETRLCFGPNTYEFRLQPTADNRLVFASELVSYGASRRPFGSGHAEAHLKIRRDDRGVLGGSSIASHVFDALSSWVVYHFHDTSETSGVRREETVRDAATLRADAGNLAPFLLSLQRLSPGIVLKKQAASYAAIRDTIRLVAPFFDDFRLESKPSGNDQVVLLEWKQRGSDYPFHPSQLSDGTLRFACMCAALLQPNPPATMVFDEPELGLHPYALTVLAGLIKQAATRTQVIVSTQSATLLDHFEPEDVIVVDRKEGASTFRRLESHELKSWLEDYTLGELWRKNTIEGGPAHE